MTVAQEKRWQAEYEIIKSLGSVPSCREMQRLLKNEYGIIANHNTINADLKLNLESLSKEDYNNEKSSILKMINDEINIAHGIATSALDEPEIQLKAMNTVSKLSKTKSEILIKFKKAQAQISKEEKPEINIFIGEPRKINEKRFKKLDGVLQDENTEMDK